MSKLNEIVIDESVEFPPRLKLDGFSFSPGVGNIIGGLYIAHRARNGDEDAIAFLTALRVTIVDSNGKQYWPKVNDNNI